jgi:hypothetical protein
MDATQTLVVLKKGAQVTTPQWYKAIVTGSYDVPQQQDKKRKISDMVGSHVSPLPSNFMQACKQLLRCDKSESGCILVRWQQAKWTDCASQTFLTILSLLACFPPSLSLLLLWRWLL